MAVGFNKEEAAQRAMVPAEMLSWAKQIESMRQRSPVRAAFHMLCLRTGQRPGELARAEWKNLDLRRRVLLLTDTKAAPTIEIPLTISMMHELGAARDAGHMIAPGSQWIFPAFSARGHIAEWHEKPAVLSHWGNAGRHTFKTLATGIGVDDLISDLLQGRSLKRAGLAGRGYINKRALLFGPLLDAQRRISAEITRRLEGVHG